MPQISQKRSASIKIDLTPEQQEEYNAIARGRADLEKREGALRAAIRDLPHVQMASNLAGRGLGAGATLVDFHNSAKSCTVRFEIDEVVEITPEARAKLRVPPQSVFMDPKTLNLLLSGKLISDKEKRDLVRTVYPALGETIVDDMIEGNQAVHKCAGDPTLPGFQGEIEVGDRFVWEMDKPHARELIRVTKIQEVDNDERRIWSVPVATGRAGDLGIWNEESRFREACVKVDGEIR